jgi:hypothetical protein
MARRELTRAVLRVLRNLVQNGESESSTEFSLKDGSRVSIVARVVRRKLHLIGKRKG